MSYVVIWLQACLHWRYAYFQTVSWSYTIFVVDWNILYKLCGSANKWSKGFVFSGKIWWQFFSCNKACSKYHTRSTTTPKYTLTQRLVSSCFKSYCKTRAFLRHWLQNETGLQTSKVLFIIVKSQSASDVTQLARETVFYSDNLFLHVLKAIAS